MNKLLYIDTETTGLDPKRHGLTQVAALVVIDGVEIDRINLDINPYTYKTFIPEIDSEALQIQGKNRDEILKYGKSDYQFMKFVNEISSHLKEEEKFQIVGYNTSFDIGFLKEWFIDNSSKISNYFTYKDLDVFALVKHLRIAKAMNDCENDKLETVCEYYGIPIDAHDAMNDIVATRELYKHLMYRYITGRAEI